MSGLLVIASALGLEVLPAAVARSRLSLAPSGLARITVLVSVVGLVLVEVAAVLCALPLIDMLLGGEPRPHLFPGGPVAGIASAVMAVGLPIRVGRVLADARAQRRLLRPEAWLGTHISIGELELVVVPTAEKVAFAVPGQTPQIVISRGALEGLDRGQLLSIIRHEKAHLAHHHTAYLALASVLAPLTRVPLVGDSMRSLPGWLERWADDESAVTLPERQRVRQLLQTFAVTDFGAAATSIVPRGTVAQRLAALEAAPARSSRLGSVIVGVSIVIVGVVGVLPILFRLF